MDKVQVTMSSLYFIYLTSDTWNAQSTMKLPKGFERGTSKLIIQ